MIRINLARSSSVITSPSDFGGGSSSSGVSIGNVHPAAKVLVIFVLPAVLYFYEQRELGFKAKQLAAEKVKLDKIKADVGKYGSVTSAVEDIKVERNKLQKRLEVIAKISRKRATKILTISELQSVIPNDSWLTSLSIQGSSIKLAGYARSPSSVQTIVERLTQLEFLESAINNGVTRTKVGSTNLHSFSIDAVVKENR